MLSLRHCLTMAAPPIENPWRGWRPILPLLFVLTSGTCFAGNCSVPKYREGHVWEDTPSSLMMNISIRIADFAPARLVCLAKALQRRYSDRTQISIPIFSSRAAAKHYTHVFGGDFVGKPRVMWELQMHALYSFDADKRQDYMAIMPFGSSGQFETRINLPATVIPKCTLEITDRCLLALDDLKYPWDALNTKASGTVTVVGVIARDGMVKDVALAPEPNPGEIHGLLVEAALKNLKTWRFETASHSDPIRIAYSYIIETSGSAGHTSFQFDLPRKVEIRGTPPR